MRLYNLSTFLSTGAEVVRGSFAIAMEMFTLEAVEGGTQVVSWGTFSVGSVAVWLVGGAAGGRAC